MSYFKGKSYPLSTGMIVRYRMPIRTWKHCKSYNCGFRYCTVRIIGESFTEKMQKTFKIRDEKHKKHIIKASQLYKYAEIVSLGTYPYRNDIRENFPVVE